MDAAPKKVTPDRIKRWNWGAFVFGWLWGIFNSVWISLLTLIPFVNVVMIFVLGVKGNQWAWEKSDLTDVDLFLKKQRKWNIAAAIFTLVFLLVIVAVFVAAGLSVRETQNKIIANLDKNSEVIAMLGSPLEATSSLEIGSYTKILRNGKQGTLNSYEFDLKGSKISAHLVELWLNYENHDTLIFLEVKPENGQSRILVELPKNDKLSAIAEELLFDLTKK
jgi:hypothetical protein